MKILLISIYDVNQDARRKYYSEFYISCGKFRLFYSITNRVYYFK